MSKAAGELAKKIAEKLTEHFAEGCRAEYTERFAGIISESLAANSAKLQRLLQEVEQIALTHPLDDAQQDAIRSAPTRPLMLRALRDSIAAAIHTLAERALADMKEVENA